jgi:7,8-dihydro-6-hydroxymethylpterin dimethyltransferase
LSMQKKNLVSICSDHQIISNTQSVCPICLNKLEASRQVRGNDLYLVKTCPDHGVFETIIRRGDLEVVTSIPERIPAFPENPFTKIERGCPYDCGLCPEHRQQPCCVLLELTQHCDLSCPVCYASAGNGNNKTHIGDPDLGTISGWFDMLLSVGGPFNIQLSGGEPCMRDDLPEIITIGRQKGFTFFQLNTNGLRIAREKEYLSRLKQAGLSTVYLQFDGTTDAILKEMRGREILSDKIAAIRNCCDFNIGVVLVPTIKPGVNDSDIGNILRFALKYHPVVRGVHFQPVSYFGRYPKPPADSDRITLPEVISAMQAQTDGLLQTSWFTPSGGPNRFCSFNGNFVVMEDETLKPIISKQSQTCCCTPQDAAKERGKAQAFVARNWKAPETEEAAPVVSTSFGGWDAFLARAKTHLFAISGMAFQDAWTLDLERLLDCYIMVVSPDNRLIPFCAYNLTNAAGTNLYRSRHDA